MADRKLFLLSDNWYEVQTVVIIDWLGTELGALINNYIKKLMNQSIQIWQIYVNSYLYDYRNDGHCLFCFRNGMTTTWAWCDTTTNLTPSTWSTLVWTRCQRSTTGTRVGTVYLLISSLTWLHILKAYISSPKEYFDET